MRRLLVCLILIYLSFYQHIAQEVSKTFTLSESEKLLGIEDFENTIVIRILDEKTGSYSVSMYDYHGNNIIKLDGINRYVIRASHIESFNLLLVILWGDGRNQNPMMSQDLLRAYNTATGTLVWEITSKAGTYELSPNNKFLITSGAFEREGISDTPLEIINLFNGQKIQSHNNFVNCYSNWLSDNKIAIIKNTMGYTEEYASYMEKAHSINNHITDIINARKENKERLLNGEINKDEYELSKKNLNDKRIELEKEIQNIGKLRPKKKSRYEAAKLFIYNFNNSRVELEKEIISTNNKQIHFDDSGRSDIRGRILQDESRSLYFIGFEEIGAGGRDPVLVKLNSEGQLIWTKSLKDDLSYGLFPFSYNGQWMIKVLKNRKYFLMTNGDGTLLPAENFVKDPVLYQLINNGGKLRYGWSPKFEVSEDEKHITFTGD